MSVQAAFPTLRLEFYQCPQPWHPQGGALHEAAKINRSLSLLGKVIYDLVVVPVLVAKFVVAV